MRYLHLFSFVHITGLQIQEADMGELVLSQHLLLHLREENWPSYYNQRKMYKIQKIFWKKTKDPGSTQKNPGSLIIKTKFFLSVSNISKDEVFLALSVWRSRHRETWDWPETDLRQTYGRKMKIQCFRQTCARRTDTQSDTRPWAPDGAKKAHINLLDTQ